MHKKYIKIYIAIIILALLVPTPYTLPVVGNYLYLKNHKELLSLKEIIEIQQNSDEMCFYGTAVRDDVFYYKMALIEYIKPKILMFGSSKASIFKQNYFSKSFVNSGGGGFGDASEGSHFLKKILEKHKPKIVFISIDFWWFADRYKYTSVLRDPEAAPPRLTKTIMNLPSRWLKNGKIKYSDYFKGLSPFYNLREGCFMGVRARTEGWGGWGWSPDGSDMGVTNPDGSPQYSPEDFSRLNKGGRKSGIQRIQSREDSHWLHDKKADSEAMKIFIKMVKSLESQGVLVVAFIPPMAPEVYKKFHEFSEQYSYIAEMKEKMDANNIKIYDLQNPEMMSLNDCHFAGDQHFPGFTAATILKTLVELDGSGTIRSYVDMDYVLKNLEKYSNSTTVVDRRKTEWNEIEAFRHHCIFDKVSS